MSVCVCVCIFAWVFAYECSVDMHACVYDYFCVHVCGLSEMYWPTLMLLCLYEFHTAHTNEKTQHALSLFSFL